MPNDDDPPRESTGLDQPVSDPGQMTTIVRQYGKPSRCKRWSHAVPPSPSARFAEGSKVLGLSSESVQSDNRHP
jgi:hypothetical protein